MKATDPKGTNATNLPDGCMTHSQFVSKYRDGVVTASVDRRLAMALMNDSRVPGRYRAAHLFWSWAWLLSIPAAILLVIFVKWWVGIIVLLVGLALPAAIKSSACQFVLDSAIENEDFYNLAVDVGALKVTSESN